MNFQRNNRFPRVSKPKSSHFIFTFPNINTWLIVMAIAFVWQKNSRISLQSGLVPPDHPLLKRKLPWNGFQFKIFRSSHTQKKKGSHSFGKSDLPRLVSTRWYLNNLTRTWLTPSRSVCYFSKNDNNTRACVCYSASVYVVGKKQIQQENERHCIVEWAWQLSLFCSK